MNKELLRKQLLHKRKSISNRSELSQRVADNFLPWIKKWKPNTIFTYMAFGTELDLQSLLQCCPKQQKWAIPKVVAKGVMHYHLWEPGVPLQKNRWGIDEPVTGAKVFPSQKDMVIIPCVGVDHSGIRLGYGGGFYDRYFQGVSGLRLVGAIFSQQLIPLLPRESHDLRVGWICDEISLRPCYPV